MKRQFQPTIKICLIKLDMKCFVFLLVDSVLPILMQNQTEQLMF